MNLIRSYNDNVVIYPNPLIYSSLISLPENIKQDNNYIDIFNIQGRKVKELHVLNNYQITLYRADFNAAGVYFVRIKSDKYLETIKLLVQ